MSTKFQLVIKYNSNGPDCLVVYSFKHFKINTKQAYNYHDTKGKLCIMHVMRLITLMPWTSTHESIHVTYPL